MSEEDTLPPPPGPPERGVIAGKYRLTRLLGRGGMGAVWEGVHITLATRVAVKLIEVEHLQSPDSLRRFENEAHAAARLQSKHVVEVYDHGVTEDGRAFIVMQYLQGEPLDRRLERLGRLSPGETARIVLQVCRALSKAHALGIVHRDLKPENIFLVWDEEDGADIVKVVDFGIAKFIERPGEAAGTHTGYVLGTPYYMSPEQARGLKTLDHRSDLWSVGVIAFRCMVGRLPFEGESVGDVIVQLCTGPIPVPSEIVPDLPPGFDAWIANVLTRDLAVRVPNAAALAESLAIVCGIPIRPHGTGDVPIHSFGDGAVPAATPGPIPVSPGPVLVPPGPIITPSYPENYQHTPTTLASRLGGATPAPIHTSTGGALTNTPTPAASRTRTSIFFAIVMGLAVVGIGAAALVRVRASTGATAAGPPLPSAAPPAVAAPVDPVPSAAPPPSAAETPSAQNPTVPPSASASAAPSASERPTGKAPRRSPTAPAPSNRATPNLDIRLER